ncbi:MAG TPA: nickel-dependent hydrogenase large subunit [Candidatus Limnocylindrales bacterium]
MARTVIDPVTRAGGNLRVEFTRDSGAIGDAWVSGMGFRGIELALAGRDPRDAWTLAERICGTCSGVHALASVRAVENALGARIPVNARLIRNLLAGTMLVRDHVMSLYLGQLSDWVDAKSATTADAAATAALAAKQADRPNATAADFAWVRDRLAAEIGSGHPTVLGNGWWGHAAYRLSPEQNLLLAAHMLEALDWQREFMCLHALLGGKDPHPQTYLVGGMAVTPPWGGPTGSAGRDHPAVPDRDAPEPLSHEGFAFMEGVVKSGRDFVTQVFAPDVALLAGAYRDWLGIGAGPGGYLSAGEYPSSDTTPADLLFPTGRLDDGNLERSQPVVDGECLESVGSSWYRYGAGSEALLGGGNGETSPAWPGLPLPIQTLEGSAQYSWVKSARYRGVPMEVGPLARVLVGLANGRKDLTQALGATLGTLNLQVPQLQGVIGRLVARSVEADLVIGHAATWLSDLKANLATGDIAVADVTSWDPESWPGEAEGFSLGEGPRGAVGHWVTIRDKVVTGYQVIDASTWNLSPRDAAGSRGPLEAALLKTPIADPARPLEALRVVHSFAPCAGCAAHTFGVRRDTPVERRSRPEGPR